MYLSLLVPILAVATATPVQVPFLSTSPASAAATTNETTTTTRVALTLGVMSRCPDAEICETLIDRVLDTHTDRTGPRVVGDLVRLKLVYLAKTFGNLTCLHGPLECKANVQQLCAAAHWSRVSSTTTEEVEEEEEDDDDGLTAEKGHGEWKTWWNFVQCMNYGKRDRIGDVSTAKACAKVVGREWTNELEECSKDSPDSEGAKLFRRSVALSKKLEIEKSCTIVLDSKKICVHDGTWKQCPGGHEVGDFVAQIKDEYKRLNTPTMQESDRLSVEEDETEEGWVTV
ncbi:hypothetical protein JCM11491_005248 [Sporobolomyces phaffii]